MKEERVEKRCVLLLSVSASQPRASLLSLRPLCSPLASSVGGSQRERCVCGWEGKRWHVAGPLVVQVSVQ